MSRRSRQVNHLPSWLVAATLMVIPFVHTSQSLDPVSMPRLVALSAGTILIGIALLWAQGKSGVAMSTSIPVRTMIFGLAGYVLVVALSVMAAGNPAETILETSRAAVLGSLVIVFAQLLDRDAGAFDLLARCLTLLAIGLASIRLAQYYGIAFDGYVPYAGLANRNLLASALCLTLPFVLYVHFQGNAIWQWLARTGVLLVLVVVVLSNSRATWFALVVATAVALIAWWLLSLSGERSKRRRPSPKGPVLTLVGMSLVVAVLFSMPFMRKKNQRSVVERAVSTVSFERGSVAERFKMWRISLSMVEDNPWLGVGAGNWKLVSPAYGPPSPRVMKGDMFFQRPHNDYLWILSESGPPALLCYLALFVAAIIMCVRTIRTRPQGEDRLAATTILFGLILYMIIAFFSYPKERMVHTMLLALMLGSSLSFYRRGSRSRPCAKRFPAVLVTAIVLAVPGLLIGMTRLASETHIMKAMKARTQGDWPTVIREVDRASSRWIQIDHTATPLSWHRGIADFTLGNQEAACEDFSRAYEVHPNHIHVLNNLATCYELEGKHDTAEYYYRRALQIIPGFEETVVNLAASLYNAGRYSEALTTIQSIKPVADDARYDRYLKSIKQKTDSMSAGH